MLRQTAARQPGVAAAVIVHEGRVLMVRRRVSEGSLSWQFPARKVEPGETREPLPCVRRKRRQAWPWRL